MRKRRRTLDSRSLLSENENLDTSAPTSFAESSTTTTPAQASTAPTTTSTIIAVSTIPNQTTTTTTLKSDVWQHFERVTDVFPLKAKCKTCSEELATPNYGTTSLKRHLVQRHNLHQFASNKVSSRQATSTNLSKAEKKRLDELAVEAVIKDSRAFGDFHKSGIKKFIDALKPGKILFFLHN